VTTFVSHPRPATHPADSAASSVADAATSSDAVPGSDQASRLRTLIAELGSPVTRPAFAPVSASRIGPANAADPTLESAARVERAVRHAATVVGRTVPIIAIGSGKGGVGKTNTAVNLSIALASLGLRATLIDADLGMANADVMCGIMPGRRLDQAISSRSPFQADPPSRTLAQIALAAPGGFRLVPGTAGASRMADLSESDRLSLLDQFAALESDSDVLIVDTGAGLSPGVTTFLSAADLTLVLATPEPTSIADAYALIKCLRSGLRASRHARPDAPIALVVSQARDEVEANAVHQRIDKVCRRFLGSPLALAGWIKSDAAVGEAVRRRVPLLLDAPGATAATDVHRLALQIAGRLSLPIRATRAHEKSGWLSRLARVFHISTMQ